MIKRVFWDYLPAVLTGFLLICSFPRLDQGYLAWVALVPLLLSAFRWEPNKAFWLGGAAGLVANLGIFYWVINAMVVYGGLPIVVALLILLLLVGFLSLYTAVFSFLISYLAKDNSFLRWTLPPLLWTTLEFLRAHIMSGFPWASLGYSQYLYLPIIQTAEVTGFYGVTFLIVLVTSTVATFLHESLKDERKLIIKISTDKMLLTGLLVFLVNFAFGTLRIGQIETHLNESSAYVNVSLIQGNITQDKKWDEAYRDEIFKTHLELTRESLRDKPDLVIWPESSVPFLFLRDKVYTKELLDFVSEEKVFLLFGGDYLKGEKDNYQAFNSAFLLSPGPKLLGRYDKNHLVPFGEYIPLKSLLFFVNKMVVGEMDYSAGGELNILKIPRGAFGVQICYEIIFPELSRRLALKGADFMAVVTNDAWFGRTSAPYQHFSMMVFRAIETRRPFVRAANTGITGGVDQVGRITSASPIFVKGVFPEKIRLSNNKQTLYSRSGDAFAMAVALITIILTGLRFLHVRKERL